MPELPEVETIARQLNAILPGKKIKTVTEIDGEFAGKEISGVTRKAKVITVSFGNWDKKLMIHLKMTGQLIYVDDQQRVVGGHPTADWVSELPSKHTKVIIEFSDGSKLFFNDLRGFGWMKLVDSIKYQEYSIKQPPDVVDGEFSQDYFRAVLSKTSRPIKLVLMDQTKMGGIGNIYANDALFWAGVDPRRQAKKLEEKEIDNLYKAIKKVIQLGIKYGGASESDYIDVSGMGGKYQEHFLVYKQNGKKCRNCTSEIKKIKLGGRGTYYCPVCQI